ncbi:hypothetical protein T492DRAFT_500756 [Pavlovales sp. CCMP2436]|nr:hypothetical protein T492DRAFT_500756 [Pavlovales sp. CCMP2436]
MFQGEQEFNGGILEARIARVPADAQARLVREELARLSSQARGERQLPRCAVILRGDAEARANPPLLSNLVRVHLLPAQRMPCELAGELPDRRVSIHVRPEHAQVCGEAELQPPWIRHTGERAASVQRHLHLEPRRHRRPGRDHGPLVGGVERRRGPQRKGCLRVRERHAPVGERRLDKVVGRRRRQHQRDRLRGAEATLSEPRVCSRLGALDFDAEAQTGLRVFGAGLQPEVGAQRRVRVHAVRRVRDRAAVRRVRDRERGERAGRALRREDGREEEDAAARQPHARRRQPRQPGSPPRQPASAV